MTGGTGAGSAYGALLFSGRSVSPARGEDSKDSKMPAEGIPCIEDGAVAGCKLFLWPGVSLRWRMLALSGGTEPLSGTNGHLEVSVSTAQQ